MRAKPTAAKPASKRSVKPTPIYQLQILLNGSQPDIWRRIQVPGTANLGWLHAVLQVAMGWTNSHLHQFFCGEQMYGDSESASESFEGAPDVQDERKVKVGDLLSEGHEGLTYEYDFGDSWGHLVTVEKVLPGEASASATAVCLAGARACPPEDCGGIGGYEELLKVLKNRKHPEHKSMKEWLGRPFDPEAFNLAMTNRWLAQLTWPHVTEERLRKILLARDGYQA